MTLEVAIDMRYWQPAYSVFVFLTAIEHERIRCGEDSISVEIIPTDKRYKKTNNWYKSWPRTDQECKQCLNNIMLPMFGMLKSIKSVTFVDRDKVSPDVFTVGHNGAYIMGSFVKAYAEGVRPLRSGMDFVRSKKIVTITLREANHYPTRNSNVDEWVLAAKELRGMGYHVIFIRDTLNAGKPLLNFAVDQKAAINLQMRSMIYEIAFCNMTVSNGPAWFGIALDASMMIFRPTDERSNKNSTAEAMIGFGIPIGGQLPNAPKYQKLIWREDLAKNIVDEFLNFCEDMSK